VEGAIAVNYYYQYKGTGKIAKAELLFWNAGTETLTEDNTAYVKEMTYYSSNGGEYFAAGEGIPAKEYSNTIVVCAKFTDEDGNVHYSDLVAYSPEAYAVNAIAKGEAAGASAKNVKTANLVKCMVMYGEAARVHLNK